MRAEYIREWERSGRFRFDPRAKNLTGLVGEKYSVVQ